jgi:DNA-directed RNA polymerase specialized sigma24 family protein
MEVDLPQLITQARSCYTTQREDAYRQLIAALWPIMRRVRMGFHSVDTDDVESAAGESVINLVNNYEPYKGSVRVCFGAILTHKCVDLLRLKNTRKNHGDGYRGKRRPHDAKPEIPKLFKDSYAPPVAFIDPETTIDNVDEANHEWRKVSRTLSKFERRAFLAVTHGDTYRRTAERLGVTTKAVDNAVFQARRKIAGQLEK